MGEGQGRQGPGAAGPGGMQGIPGTSLQTGRGSAMLRERNASESTGPSRVNPKFPSLVSSSWHLPVPASQTPAPPRVPTTRGGVAQSLCGTRRRGEEGTALRSASVHVTRSAGRQSKARGAAKAAAALPGPGWVGVWGPGCRTWTPRPGQDGGLVPLDVDGAHVSGWDPRDRGRPCICLPRRSHGAAL